MTRAGSVASKRDAECTDCGGGGAAHCANTLFLCLGRIVKISNCTSKVYMSDTNLPASFSFSDKETVISTNSRGSPGEKMQLGEGVHKWRSRLNISYREETAVDHEARNVKK